MEQKSARLRDFTLNAWDCGVVRRSLERVLSVSHNARDNAKLARVLLLGNNDIIRKLFITVTLEKSISREAYLNSRVKLSFKRNLSNCIHRRCTNSTMEDQEWKTRYPWNNRCDNKARVRCRILNLKERLI